MQADDQTKKFIINIEGLDQFTLDVLAEAIKVDLEDNVEACLFILGNLANTNDQQCSQLCQRTTLLKTLQQCIFKKGNEIKKLALWVLQNLVNNS